MDDFFNIFKNKCTNCEFYSEYRNPDKLTKNKNILEGKVEIRFCEKMNDVLADNDLVACKMFEWRSSKPSFRNGAMLYYLKNKK